ncbi:MAG: cyanophycinase [Longimicrobiales bacterium]
MPAPAVPEAVARGHLFIVGGGRRSPELMRRFVELAGGAPGASILVIPLASGSAAETGAALVEEFRGLGAAARSITPTRVQAEQTSSASLLEGVTGIWFSGGDQARVTAVLAGTPLNEAIRRAYVAGAAVGGTSAGAAIMSDPMITGEQVRDTLGYFGDEFPRVARDYIQLAPGLGYLPGAILDQHFLRRERHNRLLSAVLSHPYHLGAGIDESTALIVRPDGRWEVAGESVVVVYDARAAALVPDSAAVLGARDVRLHLLPAGATFDPRTGAAVLAYPPSPP